MRKIKVAFGLEMILLLLLIFLTSIVPFASAANDPGHDILYIEQQGSSELNGTLNISQQLKVADRLYSSYLEILGNGSQPTGSFPQIYASDANTLTINSITSLYLLKDAGSMVYVGGTNVNLNISGALFFGGNNELHTSAAAGQANLSLYWGDKLLCNASESNCGWVSSLTGGGDISAVYTSTDAYIYNGTNTGDVYLRFNESKLNSTIDARATALGDGNNYTLSIGFNVTGGSATLQLNRSGSATNLTATFLMNDTTRAYPGNCTGNQVIANISTTGVTCTTPTATETDPIWTSNYSGIISNITNRILNTTMYEYVSNRALNSSVSEKLSNASLTNCSAGTLLMGFTANGASICSTTNNITQTSIDNTNTQQNNTISGVLNNVTYRLLNTSFENSTILRTYTQFSNASTSDINVSGAYNSLNLQIKQDGIDGAELADTITLDTNLAITGYNVSFDSGTLFIDSTNDYVGIGTTGPLFDLNILQSVNDAVGLLIENYNSGTLAQTGVMFYTDSAVGGFSTYSSGYTGVGGVYAHFAGRAAFGAPEGGGIDIVAEDNASSDIRFYTNGSATTNERMRIDGIGKIGVGDTTPDALLDVQSSSVANQLRVSYDDSNYGNISVNSGGNMTIRATGHVIIDIS
jgi:hypothetical protein